LYAVLPFLSSALLYDPLLRYHERDSYFNQFMTMLAPHHHFCA
jgi:hypothetical protein